MSPQTLHDLIFESNQLGIKLREFLASCDIINQNDDLGDVEERHLDVMFRVMRNGYDGKALELIHEREECDHVNMRFRYKNPQGSNKCP